MEIGSIYEINPQKAATSGDNSAFCLSEVKKYAKNYSRFTASGREAIALALKSIESNRPALKKSCLLPAYMCDTVFFPFERAGWEMHFYHINTNLQADAEALCAQIMQLKPGILFIHPYYGVDTWKSMRSLLKEWHSQGICIIEDVSQSYYLETAGQNADYIIGSLRKWYSIPDGGFVASNEPLSQEPLTPSESFTSGKLALLTQKWNYLHGEGNPEEKKQLKSEYLQKNREMENWLDHYDGISALSHVSMNILASTAESLCQSRRNANYRYLCEKLKGKTQFVPILSEGDVPFSSDAMPDTRTAPLYFPIYAKDRDDLQKFLTDHDIYAPVLWPIGKENESCLTRTERYIYDHMLALPMDQRYGLPEMQHMTEVLEQYEKQKEPNAGKPQDEKPETIAIRADANDTVATGHMMRCITIAKKLREKGRRVLFFTADQYPKAMLEQAGMEYICLHTAWDQMQEEVPALRRQLQQLNCKKLLVDSYQVTQNYFDSLKDLCQIIYIDDCFEAVYPVDMIINYNAYHVRFPYRKAYEDQTKLLLGTAYVPLREEFCSPLLSACTPDEDPFQNRHVLISSGGGDIHNALCGILSTAMEKEENTRIIFHVVVGSFNKNKTELEQLAKKYPNILLHDHVTNMAELMQQCNIAISAAGTMLFELCAMQIPTVFFVCADNQQYDSDFFAMEERMLFAGDIRINRKECFHRIVSSMEALLNDREMQQRMKRRLHEVTDGRGAERIADEIIKL